MFRSVSLGDGRQFFTRWAAFAATVAQVEHDQRCGLIPMRLDSTDIALEAAADELEDIEPMGNA